MSFQTKMLLKIACFINLSQNLVLANTGFFYKKIISLSEPQFSYHNAKYYLG